MATPQEILLAADAASGPKLLYCAIRAGQLNIPLDPNGSLTANPQWKLLLAECTALDNILEFYEFTAIAAWVKMGVLPATTVVPTVPTPPPVLPPATTPAPAAGTPSPFLTAAQAILGS
jgi:hypothetical protein